VAVPSWESEPESALDVPLAFEERRLVDRPRERPVRGVAPASLAAPPESSVGVSMKAPKFEVRLGLEVFSFVMGRKPGARFFGLVAQWFATLQFAPLKVLPARGSKSPGKATGASGCKGLKLPVIVRRLFQKNLQNKHLWDPPAKPRAAPRHRHGRGARAQKSRS
jgi:hypothetical protein